MIIVFCASVGVGAIMIVGSITTGNLRAAWCSHPASAVTVSRSVPLAASHLARWETFGLHAVPYGDDASCWASVMNGRGSTSTAGPPTPSREKTTDPSGRCHGTRPPPTLIVYENDDAAPDEASVMLSFNAAGVTWYDRAAPGATPG